MRSLNRLVAWTVMVVVGGGLGTAAYALPGIAGSGAKVRNGGTFRVAMLGVDSMDPAIAYLPRSWLLLDATCAKLMNYPDKPLPEGLRPVPEVARRYRVSKNRKVYTFTLRRGYRFNNGARLTAASFARQIERLLDPKMQSPGAQYVKDIVGADDVVSGRSVRPSGVVARGNRLVIRLTRPIADFPARLAMPFFCAVPPGLPADPEGVGAYESAGPFYVDEYRPGQRVVLRRNEYYHEKRPHHVARFVVEFTGTRAEVAERIERGTADWGFLVPITISERGRELVRKYGVDRSRLFIRPSPELKFFVLNTERPLFRNNARLRRAINYAVDRARLAAAQGYRSVRLSDQYLPTGFPGFRDARIYPPRPNVRRARTLARGRLREGKAVLYTLDAPLGIEVAQVLKQNLAAIGLEVQIKPFPRDALLAKLYTRGEPFDIAWTIGGWLTDYNDPSAFINVLLDGRHIGENSNWSYFNSRTFNRRIAAASRLPLGRARYRAYGNLDIALARDAAPMVAYASGNAWTFVSGRLDPRCRILRPQLDLAAVCLKP